MANLLSALLLDAVDPEIVGEIQIFGLDLQIVITADPNAVHEIQQCVALLR